MNWLAIAYAIELEASYKTELMISSSARLERPIILRSEWAELYPTISEPIYNRGT